MRRLLLALILSLIGTEAHAQGCGPQNPNCIVPTAPVGTSNNQAASTEFVANALANSLTAGTNITITGTNPTTIATVANPAFATSVTSPIHIGGTTASSSLTLESTSGVGTTDSIIFKTGSQATRWVIDTTGQLVGTPSANPAMTVTAPGVFTSTQQNDIDSISVNGFNSATEFTTWFGGNHTTNAFISGIVVPNTNTSFQVSAVTGWIKSNAAQVSTGGYVAGLFFAEANGNNANMFGINPVCADNASLTGVKCQNEFDFNIQNTTTVVTGATLMLSGTANPTSATGYVVSRAVGYTGQWGTAFFSTDDAVFRGAYFGTSASGNSVNSQAIVFSGRDAGGVLRSPTIFGDLNGALIFRSGKNGSAIALQDFNGGAGSNLLTASSTSITFGVPIIAPTVGNTGTDSSLILNKAASGNANNIQGQTNGSARWIIAIGNNAAEGGANSGSDFTFSAFSDAAGFIANWMTITRATGVFSIASTVAPTSNTTGALIVTGGAGIGKDLFLATGTTAIAPLRFTSGTNLTTAAAGAIEYDGKAWYTTPNASNRGVSPSEHICVISADFTLTNGTAAQKAFNCSTNGALTLPASTSYEFEAVYLITNTGTTAHTWSVLFGGTATFTSIAYQITSRTDAAAAPSATNVFNGFATAATAVVVTASSTSATENVTVVLKGQMRINGTGTVIPQVQLSAAPGGAQTMLKNSYFRAWPLGIDTVATVGNWSFLFEANDNRPMFLNKAA